MSHCNRQKSVTTPPHTAAKAKFKRSVLAATTITALISASAQETPTLDKKVERLTEEGDKLKQEVAKKKSSKAKMGHSLGADAGKTAFGGYGGLHYYSLDSK